MLRFKQKVVIMKDRKTDGRYNKGTIVGIELSQDGFYLEFLDEKSFLSSFCSAKYKVAYQDCFTNRFCAEWFYENELSTKKS